MGKASSVVWTFAAAMLKAIATDTNPTERRKRLQKSGSASHNASWQTSAK